MRLRPKTAFGICATSSDSFVGRRTRHALASPLGYIWLTLLITGGKLGCRPVPPWGADKRPSI